MGFLPKEASAQSLCRICKLSRLHPARFVGGLIFDLVVKEVAYSTISELVTSKRSSASSYIVKPQDLPANEYVKGAYVVAGISDYDLYNDDRIRSLTKYYSQDDRIAKITQYFQRHDVKIKSAYTSISYPVTEYTAADDLLSVDYFKSDKIDVRKDEFVEMLIDLTGVTALENWVS